MKRVGFGFDTHVFSQDPNRLLILGGVHVANFPGLIGHSDADVVSHAITDALLGAAGLGDMGEHFPDTDPKWARANSMEMLQQICKLLANNKWQVMNVDCTIVAELPKISPIRNKMKTNLEEIIKAPVNIKASRAEGMGALGRGEGIACWATALLDEEITP